MLRKAAVIGVALLTLSFAAQAQKKRVAVMNFDYAFQSSGSNSLK